jgi:hypothetical protein
MNRNLLGIAAALAGLLAASLTVAAQEDPPPSESTPAEEKRVLTPEELAEKEIRKECKKKICDIIATRDPEGEDVACDIVKTWREEDIVKMLGGRISWPWDKAVCQSKLEVKRRPLARAISDDSYEMSMTPQKVRCTLSQKTEGDPYVVEIARAARQIRERQGRRGAGQLGRGPGTDVHLPADLCRHRARQFGQRARARGGPHDQRIHYQKMRRGESRSASPNVIP